MFHSLSVHTNYLCLIYAQDIIFPLSLFALIIHDKMNNNVIWRFINLLGTGSVLCYHHTFTIIFPSGSPLIIWQGSLIKLKWMGMRVRWCMRYGNPIDLIIIIMRPGVESIEFADVIILILVTHWHPLLGCSVTPIRKDKNQLIPSYGNLPLFRLISLMSVFIFCFGSACCDILASPSQAKPSQAQSKPTYYIPNHIFKKVKWKIKIRSSLLRVRLGKGLFFFRKNYDTLKIITFFFQPE